MNFILGMLHVWAMQNPYFANWMSNPVLETPRWEARLGCGNSKMSEPWSLQSETDKEMQPICFFVKKEFNFLKIVFQNS